MCNQKTELEYVRNTYQPYYQPLDAEVVAEIPCPECGSRDVYYEGYRKGDEYRAFAVCHECGRIDEF